MKKVPNKKKRNRCLRLRLLTGGCAALLFASPLALLSGGTAARPLPLLFLFSSLLRRLRRLSLPRALVGGWRRPLALSSFLSIKKLTNP